jgi:protein-disulfide isomerase
MASRAEQKARARAEREERERAHAAQAARRQRLYLIGGVLAVAVIVIVVAIVVSSSGGKSTNASAATNPESASAKAAVTRVNTLLSGIPEASDNILGNSNAPITITEYGDLECSVCDAFALPTNINTSDGTPGSGVENQLIDQYVKNGKAKFVYDSLDTATSSGVTPNQFVPQQAAAYAAGLQKKAWYYIELFYNQQGQEGTNYVTQSFLDGLAHEVPGLNYAEWLKDSTSASLKTQVNNEIAAGTKADGGSASTPTVIVSGKKGSALVGPGLVTFSQVQSAINSVS